MIKWNFLLLGGNYSMFSPLDLFKFNFGTIHCKFQGYQDQNMNLSSQHYRAWSVVLHEFAGWPNSNLAPKPSTIRSKHNIYLHISVWIVFLFTQVFQIKRLSSACSVLYLHRKSNTNVLMYVNLFFIKRIKA